MHMKGKAMESTRGPAPAESKRHHCLPIVVRGPSVSRRARSCGMLARGRHMPTGKRLPVGRIRSAWSWKPTRGASLNCFPCATGAWPCRPSLFSGDRHSIWRWTLQALRPRVCACNAAETPTWATSVAWVPRKGASSSPSTTWMRPCPPVGVGPQASRSKLRGRKPEQRIERLHRPGCGPRLRPLVPRAHGRVQRNESVGSLVFHRRLRNAARDH